MKSLMHFMQLVLANCGDWCSVSTIRDWKTISDRIEHEGLSFTTIAMASFGKDFLKALEQKEIDHSMFRGFPFHAGTPRFLGGFLDLVFDRCTGKLLTYPSVDAIRSVLQICLLTEKIEIDCSKERIDLAFQKYVSVDREVELHSKTISQDYLDEFSRVATLVFGNVFHKVQQQVARYEIIPRHGSGATADGLRGNAKYYQQEYTWRLEDIFPAMETMVPNDRYYEITDQLTYLEPGEERPTKVVPVPKNQKTPRLIAEEPTVMQYLQQGLFLAFSEAIEEDYFSRSLISWKSQEPNQLLAFKGSKYGTLATLDLSEASDRVSYQLAAALFKNYPLLWRAVDATRSVEAGVPGHGQIPLAKFASMGSALCFPVESFVFMTAVLMGISKGLNLPITNKLIKRLVGKVRTYGDDIIVPTRLTRPVIDSLESFGFVVNSHKSFWNGKFRESCGKWYYDGEEVTPIRLRSMPPTSLENVREIESLVSFRNQMFLSGYWGLMNQLDDMIGMLIPFPAVESTSPALGKLSSLGHETHGWDDKLQRPFVKGVVVKNNIPRNSVDGIPALMKVFLKRGEFPFADENHLERSGRPSSVYIKRKRIVPF